MTIRIFMTFNLFVNILDLLPNSIMWCPKFVATRYLNAESACVLPPAHLHIHLTIAMSLMSPLCCTVP